MLIAVDARRYTTVSQDDFFNKFHEMPSNISFLTLLLAAKFGRAGSDTIRRLANDPFGKKTMNWGELGHNRSPLHEAVWHGHVHAVKALLESDADPNLVENDGGGPLHEAAYLGSYGLELDQMDKERRSRTAGSMDSAESDCPSLDENCDEVSARLEILRLLLDTGRCAVDMAESHGCTPLFYAADRGWTTAVKMLLDAGASVNPSSMSEKGQPMSPLIRSLKTGNFDTARVLLSHGARVPASLDVEVVISPKRQTIPADLVALLKHAKEEHGQMHTAELIEGTPCTRIPKFDFSQPPYSYWPKN